MTVDALHKAVEATVRCGIASGEVLAFEEQRVVRADADDQQHAHEMEQREPVPREREDRGGDHQGRNERSQHIAGTPQRTQAGEQEQ